jgi:hypothetical protein
VAVGVGEFVVVVVVMVVEGKFAGGFASIAGLVETVGTGEETGATTTGTGILATSCHPCLTPTVPSSVVDETGESVGRRGVAAGVKGAAGEASGTDVGEITGVG